MTSFILDIIVALSLFGVVFMLAKSVPKIDDTQIQIEEIGESRFVDFLEDLDERVRIGLEKFWRTVRIYVLRADNRISEKLEDYRKEKKKKDKDNLFED